ncbi:type II toxin-antitoxin system prevent-host-death family antitoxin [Patescibacteria group bacterium]|nr:type II toxin-antitoxin system prevent-host-death family antitoxin [Patescibacteria group bacterium]
MTEIIGVKQLYKNLARISQRVAKGESFIVVKRSKPVFRVVPYQEKKIKKYTLKDLEKLRFRTGDKKLSQKVDEIVYK